MGIKFNILKISILVFYLLAHIALVLMKVNVRNFENVVNHKRHKSFCAEKFICMYSFNRKGRKGLFPLSKIF